MDSERSKAKDFMETYCLDWESEEENFWRLFPCPAYLNETRKVILHINFNEQSPQEEKNYIFFLQKIDDFHRLTLVVCHMVFKK